MADRSRRPLWIAGTIALLVAALAVVLVASRPGPRRSDDARPPVANGTVAPDRWLASACRLLVGQQQAALTTDAPRPDGIDTPEQRATLRDWLVALLGEAATDARRAGEELAGLGAPEVADGRGLAEDARRSLAIAEEDLMAERARLRADGLGGPAQVEERTIAVLRAVEEAERPVAAVLDRVRDHPELAALAADEPGCTA